LVLVSAVDAGGVVSTKEVAIAADSVSTLPLGAATSVWVTPRSGLVQAAVVTWFTDATGQVLSVTPLMDLTLTATSSPLRELRD
jgi:hypothetical protein